MRGSARTMGILSWAVIGCTTAHPTPPASTFCDPTKDAEDCRYTKDSKQARMRCDAAGNWVTVEICKPDEACQIGWVDIESPQRIARCTPLLDAGHGPADAMPTGDAGKDAADSADLPGSGCGDGTCSANETATTCAQDCPVGIPGLACVQQWCPAQANTCWVEKLCVGAWGKLYACIQAEGGGQAALAKCTGSPGDPRAWALAVCALQHCLTGG